MKNITKFSCFSFYIFSKTIRKLKITYISIRQHILKGLEWASTKLEEKGQFHCCNGKRFRDKELPDRNDQLGKREELKVTPMMSGASPVMRPLEKEYVSLCCKLGTCVSLQWSSAKPHCSVLWLQGQGRDPGRTGVSVINWSHWDCELAWGRIYKVRTAEHTNPKVWGSKVGGAVDKKQSRSTKHWGRGWNKKTRWAERKISSVLQTHQMPSAELWSADKPPEGDRYCCNRQENRGWTVYCRLPWETLGGEMTGYHWIFTTFFTAHDPH